MTPENSKFADVTGPKPLVTGTDGKGLVIIQTDKLEDGLHVVLGFLPLEAQRLATALLISSFLALKEKEIAETK